MRTFIYTDSKSNKFWNIDLKTRSFTVNFGKVGTKGQTQTKKFSSEAAARKAHDKLVAEKLKKGYVETHGGKEEEEGEEEEEEEEEPAAAASPLQKSLEAALVENPDDVGTHSAYADYLMEQGDPRGEFIQVQLALEDPARPAKERTQLQKREKALLKKHARQWLGDLRRFLVGDWSGEDKPYHYQFARGWLDLLRVLPSPDAILASLGRSPEARLLRRLEVVYDMRYHPFDFDQFVQGPNAALADEEEGEDRDRRDIFEPATVLPPLLESPYLTNLRVFKVGFSDTGDRIGHSTMIDPFGTCTTEQVIELLGKCPRMEELYLNTNLRGINRLFALPSLGNLRLLQYYYGSDYRGNNPGGTYPLQALAKNSSLQRLTTLRLHAGRDTTIDVEEMDAVLRSRHLPSLTHLQVHMTTFGDGGPPRIVQSGILQRLKVLDIGYGTMTDEGARILAACPDLKNLETLDVSRNALTEEGITALEATGIRVVAENQHDGEENDFLYEVDFE
jgi:uncharacterized protein (TIGR02996 family)